MNTTQTAEHEVEPHEPHWLSRSAFQVVVILILFTQIALFALLQSNASLWFAVPLVLIAGHLMHGASVAFHEASHGLLRRNRILNEVDGMIIGTLSFMSFSLYRAAHQMHHMHLSTERDEELWPFIHPDKPRWVRILAAFLELTVGLFFLPVLFLRIFLRSGSPIRSKKVRRRIWKEYALMAVVWTAIGFAVAHWHAGKYFLWMYALPSFFAGNLQSWRKYIEHVGLTGSTVNSSTRSIVAHGLGGKLVAFTLLHEPYHGVHHLHMALPHAELPARASALQPQTREEMHPFANYRQALVHLLRSLADPRVGAQWRSAAQKR